MRRSNFAPEVYLGVLTKWMKDIQSCLECTENTAAKRHQVTGEHVGTECFVKACNSATTEAISTGVK